MSQTFKNPLDILETIAKNPELIKETLVKDTKPFTHKENLAKHVQNPLVDAFTVAEGQYVAIFIDKILPNPNQPRINFDDVALSDLARDIAANGLIQPIIVRECPQQKNLDDEEYFYIVAGERRWRALKLLGQQYVPCVIKTLDDKANATMALSENLSREDLTDFESYLALNQVLAYWDSRQELMAHIGIAKGKFYRFLAFDEFSSKVHDLLKKHPSLITAATAQNLVKLKKDNQISDVQFQTALIDVLTTLLQSNKLSDDHQNDAIHYKKHHGLQSKILHMVKEHLLQIDKKSSPKSTVLYTTKKGKGKIHLSHKGDIITLKMNKNTFDEDFAQLFTNMEKIE